MIKERHGGSERSLETEQQRLTSLVEKITNIVGEDGSKEKKTTYGASIGAEITTGKEGEQRYSVWFQNKYYTGGIETTARRTITAVVGSEDLIDVEHLLTATTKDGRRVCLLGVFKGSPFRCSESTINTPDGGVDSSFMLQRIESENSIILRKGSELGPAFLDFALRTADELLEAERK